MPKVELDDLFRRYAQSLKTWHRDSPARLFAAAAREVTGTPDTYGGGTANIASADYGPNPYMLADVYAGEHTIAHWGPQALPEMVRLADARVLGRQFERLLATQQLTPALSRRIVDAVVQTNDVKQAARLFGVLINNSSLPDAHRRALVDWVIRRVESHDVIDPTTGKLQQPRLSAPPSPDELVQRLGAQADPALRAFAPGLAKAGHVSPAVLRRAVLGAMADPNPLVRNAAAPLLREVDPPSRQRIRDLIDAYFSKAAKAKVRREIEAELGPLPKNPDLEGDVLPRGDFYPDRMRAAAEMQAEFLGTLLGTTPTGAELDWLIGVALPYARHNYGLTADVLTALKRNGGTPQQQADAVSKLLSDSDDVYALLSRTSLDLVAAEPSLAKKLQDTLPPEVLERAGERPGGRPERIRCRTRGAPSSGEAGGWRCAAPN